MSKRSKSFYQRFKSILEGQTFDHLHVREKKYGFVAKYESERLPYTISGTYTPDFILAFANGHKRYIETKGYFDYPSQRKMVAVRVCHPELDIRILFSRDHVIRKGSKTRYSDWAKKHGFPFAIGNIPDEWLIEPVIEGKDIV